MIGNQSSPFYLWKLHSDDELRALDLSGAKIELASRTKQPEDIELAIKTLDDNSFNSIFILSLAENDAQLKELLYKLDSHLTPILTNQRNLKVEDNEELFRYLQRRVSNKITGPLNVLVELLEKIEKRPITSNSTIFKKMESLGYSRSDTLYLNYTWTKDKVGTSSRIKTLALLLDEYFYSEEELNDVQKKFIKRELLEKFRYEFEGCITVGEAVGLYCQVSARNYNNWLFARELTTNAILPKNNRIILSIPFLQCDEARFRQMDKEEQFYSLDYCLEGIKTKQALQDLLQKFDCMDYLTNFDRKFSQDTMLQMLRLDILTYKELTDKAILSILSENKYNYEIVKYLMSPECSVDITDFFNLYNSFSLNTSIIFSDRLSHDNQREFISFLIQKVYDNYSSTIFVRFIINLLSNEQLLKYYDKQLLLEISQFLSDNFHNNFPYSINDTKLLKIYMEPDDYESFLEDRREQQALKYRLAEEKRINEFKAKVEANLNIIEDSTSLHEFVTETYCYSGEKEILWSKACVKAVDLLKDAEHLEESEIESYLSLYYEFFNKGFIELNTYLSCITHMITLFKQEVS